MQIASKDLFRGQFLWWEHHSGLFATVEASVVSDVWCYLSTLGFIQFTLLLVGLLVVLCENLASSLFKGAPGRLRIPIKASWAKLSFDLRPNIGIRSHNEKILG